MNKIKTTFFLAFFLFSASFFSQVVDEIVQLDTTFETLKVIYKPIVSSTYYFKKIAVFAADTSQVAIEKTFTNYGQNGVYKVYYPTGRLKVFTVFANNKINGEWTWYDKKGIILVKGIYKNGVKNGYWAYKHLKIYGRYKKGLKNRKWKRFDVNKKKYISHYKKGILISGEGYGNDRLPSEIIKDSAYTKQNNINGNGVAQKTKEYDQAISFLTENIVFKKKLKAYFGGSSLKEIRAIKKYYKQDKFQFSISPSIINLDYGSFYKESIEGKIQVPIIDSLLKMHTVSITPHITKVVKEDNNLRESSTKKTSAMLVYFGEVKDNLLRIDVVKNDEEPVGTNFLKNYNSANKNQKFSILLYFNNEGILKAAEYQKP